jgi:uncharacterized protein YjbI with pentapeptide repeats
MPNGYLRKGGEEVKRAFRMERERAERERAGSAGEETISVRNVDEGDDVQAFYDSILRGFAHIGRMRKANGRYEVRGLDLRGVRLFSVRFGEHDFSDCDFSGAIIGRLDASGVTFTRCNLSGADVRHSDFYKATFNDCNLIGAAFRGCFMEKAVMGADVSWAEFNNCKFGTDQQRQESFKNAFGVDTASFNIRDFRGRRWGICVGSRAKRKEMEAEWRAAHQARTRLPGQT